MQLRRLSTVLLTVGAAAALTAAVPLAAGQAWSGTRTPANVDSVTLITGDRVIMSSHGTAVERAPGRAGVRFVRETMDGDQYVIPVDALPLLRAGRLDRQLFDLTALRQFGYTSDKELPLLLQYPETGKNKGPAGVRAAVNAKARVSRDLAGVGMLAVRAPRTARADLWTSLTSGTASARTLRPGIERVYLDGKLTISDDVSNPQIGAPTAWQQGLDGTGVTVAVLDTGIDATHPDFTGKIVASQNFTAEPSTDDLSGHGTHVASTIAGSGAESGGKYKGVAPGAKLAIGKVCESSGYCDESSVLAGMQWAAQVAPVVNMSLSMYDTPDIDPLEQAVDDLTAADGTLFVIAAGNRGGLGKGTIMSPGTADAALTVGAVDEKDQLAVFSSRGPVGDDEMIKPDITAPGVGIIAARAANGHEGEPAADGYVSMDGTSMATPHVAGAAAIITEQHPGWSPEQRKTLLMGAAQPSAGTSVFDQGAGRLDVARAVHQTVSVDEGSLSFGKQAWPHNDDQPVTKTLTYRNGGSAPITLTLAIQGDTDTFSVAATSLTVPAGGTATTSVTCDTSGAGTDGPKSGWVVATGPGDVRVETPLGVDREVEMHDVTIRHIGRDGQPNTNYWTSLIGLDGTGTYQFYLGEEAETIRVPKGTYGVLGLVYGTADTTMLVQTSLVIDGTTTITLDARQGQPVKITPPRADARQAMAEIGAFWTGNNAGGFADSIVPGDLYTAQIGPQTKQDEFVASVQSVFAQWRNDDDGFLNSPYTYETIYVRGGTFYTGFDKQISPAELTTVKASYAREADGASGVAYNWPVVAGNGYGAVGLPFSLPFERTEYIGGSGSDGWMSEFDQVVQADPDSFPVTVSQSSAPMRQFQPGTVCQQDWNRAVFAPSTAGDVDVAVRDQNTIAVSIPLFDDGSGRQIVSSIDSAHLALFANGARVAGYDSDHGQFEVPAAKTNYRLEMSATRAAPFRLSTSVSGAWTFSSSNGDTRLPLSTVRFSPRLNANNAAAAGAFTVPVSVERTASSAATSNRTLTAQFSVDDGKTWQPAIVTGSGDKRIMQLTNPATGFVSLRVNATDTAGNTTAVTVIRAYAIG